MKRLVCLVLVVAFARTAGAQEAEDDSGPYVGLSLGALNHERDNGQFGLFVDDATSEYKIVGGYRFNDRFALEGTWGKTGDLEDNILFGSTSVGMRGEHEVFTVRALGFLPLGEKVSLYGALGYYDAKLDATVTTGFFPGSYDVTDDAEGTALAVGVQFELERVDIRAELGKLLDSGSETWDFNVGVFFRF